jgi:hypothetical protein
MTNPYHEKFKTAEVWEEWNYPFDQVIAGQVHHNTRNNLNAIRCYYQEKLGRKYQLRVDRDLQCYVMRRMPDDHEPARGRPLGAKSADKTRGQLGNARRQAAYRARVAARFAHAFTAEGWKDQSPDLVEYRKRAAFQLANTTAVIEAAWREAGSPKGFEFKLKKEHIGEVHPNAMRAANLVEQKLAQVLGVPVGTEHTETTVAGRTFQHFVLVIGAGERQAPAYQVNVAAPAVAAEAREQPREPITTTPADLSVERLADVDNLLGA